MIRIRSRKGAVLVMSLIFVLVFSALGVSIASMSGKNVQLAWNQQQVSRALTTAHSGLDVVRYHFQGVTVPASIAPADRLQFVASSLQTKLTNAGLTNISDSFQGEATFSP